ncbi:hypothetical protein J4P02_15365 [Pseudomonas sp. NFXW11]|uniref:hypothetical protein n=1 Tax=Pseudomonas sp. NFXW11 TaxID=2819531 RepID=UPI003CF16429
MNRQRLAQLRIAPRPLQQGLFASLALLVTLIAGQQFLRWQDSQAPAVQVPLHHFTQSHFSSLGNRSAEVAPAQLMVVDEAQRAPRQERWVF